MVVGTIEYMAPEQSRGEAVDQRADVYAFGLILYDLLLGRTRAARVKSAIAELQNRMREAPPPLREVDPTIPVAVERIVMRCVQPDAADRFATSRELEGEFAKLDAHGVPLPLAKRITWMQATAAGVAMVVLLGTTYWSARGPAVAVKHEPVSILITDLKNETGDKTFDRALEPMLKLALEGAGFISAYDRNGIRRSLGVVPPEVLDEKAGRALAVQQGVGVVLAGSLARDGSDYTVTLKATESVTGNTIATESDDASGRDGVLAVATDLGNRIRTALGDNTSDSTRRFATEKLSATSLEVVREYALAMQALSSSQFAEARGAFERAIKIDPNFGLAYAGLASAASNMGQPQEAERFVKEAIRHVDRMTERERLRTRGLLYYITSDYEACVKEYGDLLAQYEADVAARNNLALCSTKLRNMARARDEMTRVVAILPKRSLYRLNASLYSTYAGDFPQGERDALVAQQLGDRWALQALALAKLGQNDFGAATAAYEALGQSVGAGPLVHGVGPGRHRAVPGTLRRGGTALHATAPPPISRRAMPIAPRASSSPWRSPSCRAAGRARPSPPPTRPWPTAAACRSGSWPVAPMPRPARSRRRAPSPPSWSTNCRSSRRPTASCSKASSCSTGVPCAQPSARCRTPTRCSTPGSATSTWDAPIWAPRHSLRPIPSSTAA